MLRIQHFTTQKEVSDFMGLHARGQTFKMKISEMIKVLDGDKCYGEAHPAWKRECTGRWGWGGGSGEGCEVGVVLWKRVNGRGLTKKR